MTDQHSCVVDRMTGIVGYRSLDGTGCPCPPGMKCEKRAQDDRNSTGILCHMDPRSP